MRVNIRLQSILKGTLVLGVLFLIIVPLACGGAAAPTAPVVPTFTSPPTAVRPTTPPATSQPEPTTSAPSGDLVAAGRGLYTGGGGCAACHTIDGVAQGVLGPDQTHVGASAANRIPGYTAEQYIRESIKEPCAYNVSPADDGINQEFDCILMQTTIAPLALSDTEIDALVAFLLTQK